MEFSKGTRQMIEAGVNRNVELVQTIIYLAGDSPTQYLENREYVRRLGEWFNAYKEHEAVIATHEMILNDRFTYDRTHKAALGLAEMINDDKHRYHAWATAVKQFSFEAGFDAFFEKEEAYYRAITNRTANEDFQDWVKWTEDFWKGSKRKSNLIISMIDGNYGFSLECSGEIENFIIRCLPVFDKEGHEIWNEGSIANGIIHEYAHTYVNPVVEAHKDILSKYPDFFAAHTNMMRAYNTDYAIMNEYLVRAFTLIFLKQYDFDDLSVKDELNRHKKTFPYIESFVGMLNDFQKSGKSFGDFYPERIEEMFFDLIP